MSILWLIVLSLRALRKSIQWDVICDPGSTQELSRSWELTKGYKLVCRLWPAENRLLLEGWSFEAEKRFVDVFASRSICKQSLGFVSYTYFFNACEQPEIVSEACKQKKQWRHSMMSGHFYRLQILDETFLTHSWDWKYYAGSIRVWAHLICVSYLKSDWSDA